MCADAVRPALTAAATLACLAFAAPAGAVQPQTVVLANSGTVEGPSCPANPCVVVSRTTAVQVKDGTVRNPFRVARDGRIVAWSVTLAVPSSGQIHYFDGHEGGTSRAALAVLRNSGGLDYTVVALSPVIHMQPYFGKTAQLTLKHSLAVRRGDVVALTVPTWLPALAVGYPGTTSWRASRTPSECSNVTSQTAQRRIGAAAGYDCLYQTALVTYSATERTHG